MKLLMLVLTLGCFSAQASYWSHQTEAILNTFTGNSDATTLGAKHESTTTFANAWNFKGFGEYNYGEARGVINTRNWEAGLRLGKNFTHALEGYYEGSIQGDKFKGIDSRLNNELGIIYNFMPPVIAEANADTNETNKMGKYSFGSQFLYGKLAYLYSVDNFKVTNPGTLVDGILEPLPENRSNIKVGLGYGTPLTSGLAFLSEIDWTRTIGQDDRNLIEAFAGFRSTLSRAFSMKFGYELAYNDKPLAGTKDTDGKYVVSVLATY